MPRKFIRPDPARSRLFAAILFTLLVAAPGLARAQVVVVANGSPITAFDIAQRTKLIQTSSHKKVTRQEVIQELIDDRLKLSKAKIYGFVIPEDEVNKAFASFAERQHITLSQFVTMLSRSGIVPETVKSKLRAELTWNQLVRGKYSASLQVSESDIASAMRATNEQATTMGHIYTLYPVTVVVPSGSNAATVAAKRREAESLRARFANCKDGLKIARALRDVAVREPITRSSADLAPQLREILDKIQIGRLTDPEVTAQGLQMFAVCEKKASKTASPAEAALRNKIFAERFKQESQKFLEDIRRQAMIEYK